MNNMNNNPRQSRWGAAPPSHQGAPSGGGSGEGGSAAARDRSQSWNDPRRGGRGYDTTDAPSSRMNRGGPPPRDEPRGRWGGGDRRNSGGGGGEDHRASGGRHSYGRGDEVRGRTEERDHYGRGDDGWRCMECDLFNHPRDERCPRCRTWKPHSDADGPKQHDRRSFDDGGRYNRDNDREGRDTDGYYGPPSSRGPRRGRDHDDGDYDDRRSRKKPRDDTPKERKWPPHFESSGASFIFDSRSGMFYEPASDFFYDPKTKLYYSNKKQQYFRYEEDKKPYVFQPVGGSANGAAIQSQGQGAGGTAAPNVVTAPEETSGGGSPGPSAAESKPELKPKIAISLKTAMPQKDAGVKSLNEMAAIERTKLMEKNIQRKESALSAAGENNANPSALPQSHKKHAKDLNKWSERVKEMREEATSEEQQPPASKKIKTTASGQPICVLCRRKFANLEKLQQHEKLSKLHKENLAKKAAADAAAKEAQQLESEKYRDRSKERRAMYGTHAPASDASHAEALLAHSLGTGSSSTEAKPAEVIRPEETLNDANVGNKLLQKLGWKSGGTLGRNANQENRTGDNAASNLKSDWERIESLAQKGGRR